MITPHQKLAFGTGMLDWEERINLERLRRERPAKVRAKMKELGFAAIILGLGDNQIYATAIDPGALAGFIAGASGHAIVFTDYPEDTINYCVDGNCARQARIHSPWLKPDNIRAVHSLNINQVPDQVVDNAKKNAEEVFQDLRERGVQKEKIAYDQLHPAMLAALGDKGLKLTHTPEVLVEARMIKTQDEINCMKMAGYIANQGFWELYKYIRPGVTECEVASHAAAAFMRMGNRHGFLVNLRSGPNTAPNWGSHSPTDRMIQPGDLAFCDMIGPLFLGYRVCYYRTFKCGLKPTEKEKDWYKKCYEWEYAAMDAVKPGVSTAEIAEKWPPASTWGFKEEYEAWINCLGHGLGLSQYEPPMIGKSFWPTTIQKGMTFSLETWYGQDGVGGCRIENVVVVNDTGCENLYTWPDEEIIVPEHSLLVR